MTRKNKRSATFLERLVLCPLFIIFAPLCGAIVMTLMILAGTVGLFIPGIITIKK
jgi:hypothetical protein